MPRQTFFLSTTASSTGLFQVYPGRDYREAAEQLSQPLRLQTGDSQALDFGVHERFSLPLSWVSSADRQTIEQFWRDGEVILTWNASESTRQCIRCKIENTTHPLGGRESTSYTDFRGVLFLRQVSPAGRLEGGPFILDDAVWGLLNESYNLLT